MRRGIQKFVAFTPLREAQQSAPARKGGRIYRGVTLIQSGMGNKRDKNYYPPEVLKAAVQSGLFESIRAFADHPTSVDEDIQPERTIRDMCGIYENAKFDTRKQSVKADLRILKSHRWLSDTIDELIECGHGDKIGLSINGRGQTEPTRMRLEEAGGEEVEVNRLQQFIELRSVDVVTEAGAGGGFTSLLESARRARENQMSIKDLYTALREAVGKGDLKKAKDIEAKIGRIETQSPDEDGADEAETPKTRETAGKPKTKKGRRTEEPALRADDGDEDPEGEDDGVDHDAELDSAVAEAQDGTDPEDVEDGDDDLEEADEDDADEEADEDEDGADEGEDPPVRESGRPMSPAARQREFMATRESRMAVRGATGTPTGSVKAGGGRFTKPSKWPRKKSSVKKPSKMPVRRFTGGAVRESEQGSRGGDVSRVLRENAALREKNSRLSEALGRRASADRAKKLLRESNLPPQVRPTLVRDLIGLSDADMRAKIRQQERIIEAVAGTVTADLAEDFGYDRVEGAGASLRESHYGGRGGGDDIDNVFNDVGLVLKK